MKVLQEFGGFIWSFSHNFCGFKACGPCKDQKGHLRFLLSTSTLGSSWCVQGSTGAPPLRLRPQMQLFVVQRRTRHVGQWHTEPAAAHRGDARGGPPWDSQAEFWKITFCVLHDCASYDSYVGGIAIQSIVVRCGIVLCMVPLCFLSLQSLYFARTLFVPLSKQFVQVVVLPLRLPGRVTRSIRLLAPGPLRRVGPTRGL